MRPGREDRTSFVGRSAELDDLRRAYDEGAALVSLTGPAGVGKTRLARRFAAELLGEPHGPVWFCDLSEARSSEDLYAALGRALDAPLAPGAAGSDDAEQLGRALAARGDALVVFDNVEQIAGQVAAALEAWIEAAPRATFLATSRVRLGLAGELCVEIGPLAVPPEDEDDPARIAACDAVRLFVDRARSVRRGFTLTDADAPVVAALVRRLDGLPLAIELCAGRSAVLDPAQLLDLLPHHLDIARAAGGSAATRHATLRAAIDASWRLLTPWEQRSLARCSLFRGGFDLEAAEHVLDPASDGGDADRPCTLRTVDLLETLHAHSLVVAADAPGGRRMRYRLYESIRDFGAERLRALGDDAAPGRHAAYYARSGALWAGRSASPTRVADLARLALEQGNLVAAVEWGLSQPSADQWAAGVAFEALDALVPLLSARAPFGRYAALLDRALDGRAAAAPGAAVARVRRARGTLRRVLGRLDDARSDLETALAEARAMGDPILEADILMAGGIVLANEGRPVEARDLYERALELVPPSDGLARGRILLLLANTHFFEGRLDAARDVYERAIALLREAGDVLSVWKALSNLAILHTNGGRLEQAEEAFTGALEIFREQGDTREMPISLGNLAVVVQERGELERARGLYDEALRMLRENGDRRHEAACLVYRGSLHHEAGDLGAAESDCQHALEALRRIGDRRLEGLALAHLGAIRAERGDLDRARADLDRAVALLGATGDRLGLAAAEVHRGAVDRALGRDDEVTRRIEAALPLAAESQKVRLALRLLGRRVERRTESAPSIARPRLRVGAGARWFERRPGERVDLTRRGALRRILEALVDEHTRSGGAPRALPLDAVLEAGWPGERMQAEAGAARVYTTVQRLRRLGLEGALVTRDDGYLLDPDLPIEVEGAPPAAP